jgi:hypothetical protein
MVVRVPESYSVARYVWCSASASILESPGAITMQFVDR